MTDVPPEEKKGKKGAILKIAGLVMGGLALVGVGLGAGFFLFGNKPPSPSEQIESIIERKMQETAAANAASSAEAEAPTGPQRQPIPTPTVQTFVTSYYEFPGNFTTNLRNSRKFLQVGIGVSTQYDKTVITNVDTHQLSLRSEILGVISEFTEEDVQGKAGREAIALAMRDAINAKLVTLTGFGGVENLYFTSFILQ
jgi:flagellar FliL protein